MSDELSKTRLQTAQMVLRSATRMVRFIDLKAPPLVLESERMIMVRAIMNMPVESEYQLQAQRIKNDVEADEAKFLHDHGYYADILDGIGEEPKP